MTQTLELEAVLNLLLEYLHRLIPYSVGSVLLMESESRAFVEARVCFDEAGIRSAIPDEIDFLENPGFQKLMQRQHVVLVRNGAMGSERTPRAGCGLELSCMSVPISAGGRTLGFCCLENRELDAFSDEAVQLAEAIVAQAAVAIQNAGLFRQVRAGHDRLQSLSRRLVEVQESERIHVARELHDEAGQMLASMLLALKQLEDNAHDPPAVTEGVQTVKSVAHTVQENLNRLAMDLRPASLDYLGLVAALNSFINKLADQDGIAAQFKALGWTAGRLPAEIEISIYRIAQEALTNVVRHAHASRVDVLLQKQNDSVLLMVEDDGIGFDPELSSTHLGLVGIRERCEMLDGNVVVESVPGKGTTLVVEIPCDDSSIGV